MTVQGEVEKFATIEPKRVVLLGVVGENIEQTVTITPETKKPFKILKVAPMGEANIKCELKKTDVSGRTVYELKVVNTRDKPGRYHERLSLITDRSDHTPISIIVSGHIREKDKAAQ